MNGNNKEIQKTTRSKITKKKVNKSKHDDTKAREVE